MSTAPFQYQGHTLPVTARRFSSLLVESAQFRRGLLDQARADNALGLRRAEFVQGPADAADEWLANLCTFLNVADERDLLRGLNGIYAAHLQLAHATSLKEICRLRELVKQLPGGDPDRIVRDNDYWFSPEELRAEREKAVEALDRACRNYANTLYGPFTFAGVGDDDDDDVPDLVDVDDDGNVVATAPVNGNTTAPVNESAAATTPAAVAPAVNGSAVATAPVNASATAPVNASATAPVNASATAPANASAAVSARAQFFGGDANWAWRTGGLQDMQRALNSLTSYNRPPQA